MSVSVIVNDSVFKMDKDFYSQVFVEEWKYKAKEKKISRDINQVT